jgi:hypothetical protein
MANGFLMMDKKQRAALEGKPANVNFQMEKSFRPSREHLHEGKQSSSVVHQTL